MSTARVRGWSYSRPQRPAAPAPTTRPKPAAEAVLTRRGEQPRQKQNRLLFLAADAGALERLKDQARTYLAWASIVTDVEWMRLNLAAG